LAAGYAYCAISALYLLDRPFDAPAPTPPGSILRGSITDSQLLLRFLAGRQFEYLEPDQEDDEERCNFLEPPSLANLSLNDNTLIGFNGRWNKLADTCYCWWVGGALSVCKTEYPASLKMRPETDIVQILGHLDLPRLAASS
jgi:geranylgeranyl transferase type-1 subunit beta